MRRALYRLGLRRTPGQLIAADTCSATSSVSWLSPSREGLKVSGCRIDRNDLDLVFDASFRERRARRKALVGQITPDERIDRSGPPGLAPVCQEIADRQSPRLLPQHCDIGQAVAAQRHRRRQVRNDLPRIVDRPRRPACRRPEPRSRPARDSRSGARVSIGPRTADAHRSSAAGTNTCSGAAVSMTIAAPRCRPRGERRSPPEPAGAQRQGIATLATTCC
jgi:hypothetical protein